MKAALIIGRGTAGQRYGRLLEKSGIDISVEYHDRQSVIGNYDYVIVASHTKDHFEDILAVKGKSNHYLLEKPIVANAKQLAVLEEHFFSQDVRVFTGDQFYFSPVLQQLKQDVSLEFEKIQSVEITYSDALENVTKGRSDSYFFDADCGGVLKTFSHAFFVFVSAFSAESTRLIKVQKRKKFEHDAVYSSISSDWNFAERFPIKVTTDVENSKLVFEATLQGDFGVAKYDFINGTITRENEFVQKECATREDLIKANANNFLMLADTGQIEYSKLSLRKIWEVEAWH